MKGFSQILLLFVFVFVGLLSKAASIDTSIHALQGKLATIDQKSMNKLSHEYEGLSTDIDKHTLKALARMEKREQKLQKRLAKVDSIRAKQIFADRAKKYASIREKIKLPQHKWKQYGQYIPGLDSIETATRFLSKQVPKTPKTPSLPELPNSSSLPNTSSIPKIPSTPSMPSLTSEQLAATNQLNSATNTLKDKLAAAGEVKAFLSERSSQLNQQLAPFKMGKDLVEANKEVYYYQQQLTEYKTTLKDKQKLEAKAMSYVRELPAFQQFMSRNSQLASLFRVPENYGSAQALAGLQTRACVQQLLQSRFGISNAATGAGVGGSGAGAGGNGGGMAYLQQQMQAGHEQLNGLKDKAKQMGNQYSQSGDNANMPNFKPNTQKTKSFWKRLEYGGNMQSAKTNYLLPVTTDIAVTVGYKLTDHLTAGIGASYKLGWGNGWQQIQLSNEGLGLRSFIDIQLKGSFWATGGFEVNYLPNLQEKLRAYRIPSSGWQQSGLLGITKKYKVGKRTHNVQLLWDFLSYWQKPQGQALKWRVGL